mgnify:CR=1 FL=1
MPVLFRKFGFLYPSIFLFRGLKNWLHIKGHVAYGMFTDEKFQERFTAGRSKYTKETLFHSKAAFLKVENLQKSPVSVELGIEMAAQFGGDCYYPDGTVLRTPDSLERLFSVFFFPSNGDSGASESDQINILGNHVGSLQCRCGVSFSDLENKGLLGALFLKTARE